MVLTWLIAQWEIVSSFTWCSTWLDGARRSKLANSLLSRHVVDVRSREERAARCRTNYYTFMWNRWKKRATRYHVCDAMPRFSALSSETVEHARHWCNRLVNYSYCLEWKCSSWEREKHSMEVPMKLCWTASAYVGRIEKNVAGRIENDHLEYRIPLDYCA